MERFEGLRGIRLAIDGGQRHSAKTQGTHLEVVAELHLGGFRGHGILLRRMVVTCWQLCGAREYSVRFSGRAPLVRFGREEHARGQQEADQRKCDEYDLVDVVGARR